MPVLTDYKGIDVVEGATGVGGAAMTADFKALADRAPMLSSADPSSGDDSDLGYFVGSLWFNLTSETMWVCTDDSVGAAVWKSFFKRSGSVLTLIPEEATETVNVFGNLGIGAATPKARLHGTDSTIVGGDDAAVPDGDLGNSQINIWVDESSGSEKLKFKVKLSGGTIKTATVNLI